MQHSDRHHIPRVCDALAATDPTVSARIEALSQDLRSLQAAGGRAPAPQRQDGYADPLALAGRQLDAVRSALVLRDQLAAALPHLEMLAAQERKQARGPVVLLALLAVIVLAVLIGQVL